MKKTLFIIFLLLSVNSFSQGFFGSYDYKDPDVRISSISAVTCSSAKVNIYLNSNGGGSIRLRLAWNTVNPPFYGESADVTITVELNKNYEYEITGLLEDTMYYVMAVAVLNSGYYNSIADYSTVSNFTTATYPTVLIAQYPSITGSTYIDSGGGIPDNGGDPPYEFGLCWNSSGNPSLSDNYAAAYIGDETGFISHCTGLSPSTTYYFKAYAINSCGVSYSDQQSYTTSSSITAPAVTTYAATSITMNSAYLSGSVTSDGGASVTSRGFCWNTSGNPSLSDNYSVNGSGTGAFYNSLTGLSYNTTYYVKAYAINSVGTSYGNEVNFTTLAECYEPVISTNSVDTVWTNRAVANITLSDDGGCFTVYGICWDTLSDPTISDYYEQCGTIEGTTNCTATGLTSNTTYYLRAYATNSAGTTYGEQLIFTTPSEVFLPTVLTANITSITYNSAVSGGNVTNQGGSTVTERGIVFGTITKPDIYDTKIIDSSGGLGSYISNLTGLSPSTTYYVRAYAINSVGVAYGQEEEFTTDSEAPCTYDDKITENDVQSQCPTLVNITTYFLSPSGISSNFDCGTSDSVQIISLITDYDGDGYNGFTFSSSLPITYKFGSSQYLRYARTESPAIYDVCNKSYDNADIGGVTFRIKNTDGQWGPTKTFLLKIYNSQVTTIPTITTTPPSEALDVSFVEGIPSAYYYVAASGNISSDNGDPIIQRGIVYSTTNTNPTIGGTSCIDVILGSGVGSFSTDIIHMGGSIYYNAYAINSTGTYYGLVKNVGECNRPTGLTGAYFEYYIEDTDSPETYSSHFYENTSSFSEAYSYYLTGEYSLEHIVIYYSSLNLGSFVYNSTSYCSSIRDGYYLLLGTPNKRIHVVSGYITEITNL